MNKTTIAAAQARAFFTSQELPYPPLPARFEASLVAVSDHLFATLPVKLSAFDLEVWADRVDASSPDWALLGVDGRGINSWAMHYYLVEGPLALLVQWPWGGVYGDADADRQRIVEAFEQCATLQDRARGPGGLALARQGKRLLVVHSPLAESRCVWLEAGKPDAPLVLPGGVAPLTFALGFLSP